MVNFDARLRISVVSCLLYLIFYLTNIFFLLRRLLCFSKFCVYQFPNFASATRSYDMTTKESFYFLRKIGAVDSDDGLVKRTRRFVLTRLDDRFRNVDQVLPSAAATVLDPRSKKLHFSSPLAVSEVIRFRFLSQEIRELAKEKENEVERLTQTNSQNSGNTMWDALEQLVARQASSRTPSINSFFLTTNWNVICGLFLCLSVCQSSKR